MAEILQDCACISRSPCVKISGCYQYFWRYCCFCVSNLLTQICSCAVSVVPVGLLNCFWWKILNFNGWCYFWRETCQWHPKMLDLLQKYSGLERKFFWNNWDKMSLYFTILIWNNCVVKQCTSMCSISSTTLPHMTFVSKMSVFTCKLWENLNWLLVLMHSLLRPTSSNLKYTPWDP